MLIFLLVAYFFLSGLWTEARWRFKLLLLGDEYFHKSHERILLVVLLVSLVSESDLISAYYSLEKLDFFFNFIRGDQELFRY
jgi:hypothetical protein